MPSPTSLRPTPCPLSNSYTVKKRPVIAILANFPVWLIAPSLPTFRGHYAVWLWSLFQAFAHQDAFDIHWVTLSKDVKKTLTLEEKGQHFHILPRTRKKIGLYTFYLHDRRQVARELRTIQPDLVHSWGTEDCYGLCARDFGGNKLHSVQGILKACLARGELATFMRHHSLYEPLVLRSIPHLTTESPWAAERVREIAPQARPQLLEYAVEERFFQIERKLTPFPSCLYAGSDTPLKNVDTLIQAFSDPELSHVTLWLAGVSPETRPGLPSNIKALGRVSREKMTELMSSAWCLAHASLIDTGPTVVKEARVAGLPVILTTECGSKRYVEEGKSGFIISPFDKAALIQNILTVTSHREIALKMGAYHRDDCRHALSTETMKNRLLELYQHLLSIPPVPQI